MSTSRGLDTTQDCTPHIPAIKAAGISFVCRYASHSAWKNMTLEEVRALSKAGIYICTVWEIGDQESYFTRAQGLMDGAGSFAFCQHLGQPFNSPIYYAVDLDINPTKVVQYFQAVRESLQRHGQIGKTTYEVGVYGPGAVCKFLHDAGLVSFTWIDQSPGHSGADYADWNLKQLPSATIAGMNADGDVSRGNGGGWMVKV